MKILLFRMCDPYHGTVCLFDGDSNGRNTISERVSVRCGRNTVRSNLEQSVYNRYIYTMLLLFTHVLVCGIKNG